MYSRPPDDVHVAHYERESTKKATLVYASIQQGIHGICRTFDQSKSPRIRIAIADTKLWVDKLARASCSFSSSDAPLVLRIGFCSHENCSRSSLFSQFRLNSVQNLEYSCRQRGNFNQSYIFFLNLLIFERKKKLLQRNRF